MAASARDLAQALRQTVGQRVAEKPLEELLDLMLTWALIEKATPGEWFDGWSPPQVLTECGFGFVLNLETIRAAGCLPGDDLDSLLVVGRSGSDDLSIRLDNGTVMLEDLRRCCQSHLSTMGNHHWGTVTDIAMLSEGMNPGFMVMSNKPQQRQAPGARWMFGLNVERADFPYWMMLYNIDLSHIQLLACSDLGVDVEGSSVFRQWTFRLH